MRNIFLKTAAITLAFVAGLCIASFAQQKSTDKKKPEHWIKVYQDIVLGDQSNSKYGPFLKTATGQAVSIEDADKVQKEIGLVFFTEYNGNYATLTFPGNATAAASYGTDDIRVFTEDPGGLNHWEQEHLHSGYITSAATSEKQMSQEEFNDIAAGKNWAGFTKTFAQYNSGSGKLSYVSNFVHVELNTVYMFQLNNTVRGFLYVKNLVAKSAKGGSMKFDMIIEGSDAYGDSKILQPAKD